MLERDEEKKMNNKMTSKNKLNSSGFLDSLTNDLFGNHQRSDNIKLEKSGVEDMFACKSLSVTLIAIRIPYGAMSIYKSTIQLFIASYHLGGCEKMLKQSGYLLLNLKRKAPLEMEKSGVCVWVVVGRGGIER